MNCLSKSILPKTQVKRGLGRKLAHTFAVFSNLEFNPSCILHPEIQMSSYKNMSYAAWNSFFIFQVKIIDFVEVHWFFPARNMDSSRHFHLVFRILRLYTHINYTNSLQQTKRETCQQTFTFLFFDTDQLSVQNRPICAGKLLVQKVYFLICLVTILYTKPSLFHFLLSISEKNSINTYSSVYAYTTYIYVRMDVFVVYG